MRQLLATLAALLAVSGWAEGFSFASSLYGAEMIVGGSATVINQYPYVVSVEKYFKSQEKWFHSCGGTILDNFHILSTAKCINDDPKAAYRIRAGSTKLGVGGVVRTVLKHFSNAKFSAKTLDYDVAIFRLAKPLVFSASIQHVRLPRLLETPRAKTAFNIIGWGSKLEVDFSLSKGLRETTVYLVSNKECVSDYKAFNKLVTDRMVCAASPGRDACSGDSGGPLMMPNTKYQYGIISWGRGCARRGSPAVYTSLTNPQIRAFITQILKI